MLLRNLTTLRQARRDWRDRRLLAGCGDSDEGQVVRGDDESTDQSQDETILVLGHWQYIGRGHTHGEAIYARTIAQEVADTRRLRRLYREEELQ